MILRIINAKTLLVIDSLSVFRSTKTYKRAFIASSDFKISVTGYSSSSSYLGKFSYKIQLESGNTSSGQFESYEEIVATPDEKGNVSGITSLYPSTYLYTEPSTTMSVQYNKDITKIMEQIINAIVSLGGNV